MNFVTNNQDISAPSPSGRTGVGLKICGMKYSENISQVGELLPDYIGFIFYEKSIRFFDGIIPTIPSSIKKVGVFVNATSETIRSKIREHHLDIVQLHGKETPEFCMNLKNKNIQIIKAFAVNEAFDFEILNQYETACNYYLFDTKGALPGGNGTVFDWSILSKNQSVKPFFLSGGIGVDAVNEIKSLKNKPFAVDVNSKFETEVGLKDIKKLQHFQQEILNLN